MANESNAFPLITTKLFQPRITEDLVDRPRLLEQLQKNRQRPLTLVAAPAGYGKSTLVSSWLEKADSPGAWLALDEYDDDLELFLAYIIAAIQTIFPNVGQETQAILNLPALPPPPVLARSLINELVPVDTAFFLVLDDYHVIHDMAIHSLLTELLRHPPPSLHLVIVTRREPPLPLSRFRASGQMTEIRLDDLGFTSVETATLLKTMLGRPVDDTAAISLTEITEGWITGLNLAILSLRRKDDLDRLLIEMPDHLHYITDYLLQEVLANLPPAIKQYALFTAILDRFCAPLCEEILGSTSEADEIGAAGHEFIDLMVKANLFTISVDSEGTWYRYHHLFQRLLQNQLKSRYSPDVIAGLHSRASQWFARNDWIDESLHHALKAGDAETAIQLAVRHRHIPISREESSRLRRWLGLFSENTINQQAGLLIMRAWIYNFQGRWADMLTVLDQIEGHLAEAPLPAVASNPIRGEVYLLRANLAGWIGNKQEAFDSAQKALALLPSDWQYATAAANVIRILSCHMLGDRDQAYASLYRLLTKGEFEDVDRHDTLLLAVNCVLHWVDADLPALARVAGRYLETSQKLKLRDSTAIASFYLGITNYQRNNLAESERYLAPIREGAYRSFTQWYVQGTLALAQTYRAAGLPEQGRELVKEITANLRDMQNERLLPTVEGFQAEMSLSNGKLSAAYRWARKYNPLPLLIMHTFYVPQFTLVKVWLTQDTETSRALAAELLGQLREFVDSTNNTCQLLTVLSLQALLDDLMDMKTEALKNLENAVLLAEPGGFIRLFADLGPQMATLLKQLHSQGIATNYIEQILAVIEKDEPSLTFDQTSAPSPQPRIDSLTDRELEVMDLLARRLSNKEIAAELVISLATARNHTHNIYQKLRVKNRRQAVTKATELGIL